MEVLGGVSGVKCVVILTGLVAAFELPGKHFLVVDLLVFNLSVLWLIISKYLKDISTQKLLKFIF